MPRWFYGGRPTFTSLVAWVFAAISLAGCGRVGVELLPTGLAGDPADGGDGGVGSCSPKCENDHGSSSCVAGECVNVCAPGYADCDGLPANGCETGTRGALTTCGTCGVVCENAHGSSSCREGVCTPACDQGFADCDGDPANGCEADLTTSEACGSCEQRCDNAHGSTACVEESCSPSCASGFASCDANLANGCETNLASDPRHCGGCGRACGSAQVCVSGQCQASPCGAGRGECDGDSSMTCETPLDRTLEHCGFCGNECSAANGTPQCSAGSCAVASCNSGFADCDRDALNGCESSLATSTAHCGGCGAACTNAHGSTSCRASSCAPTCSTGWGDCDASRANGCETSLDSVTSCGSCGRVCPANGGTPTCNAGVCGVACDMSGSFALKLQVPVTWPASEAIRAGSGSYALWLKIQGTHSGSSVATTVIPCGRSVPPLDAILVNETFLYDYPASLFDETPPRVPTVSTTASLGGSGPGSSYSVPFVALVMGTTLADPLNATWPSRASGLSSVDTDADGKPGVTALYANGGSFIHPRTGTTLFSERASRPYAAARTVFSLNGRIDSCTRSTGSASVRSIDTRIFGCRLADGSRDCNASEADFLDRNCPNYRTGAATYTLVRVGASATCADVQAAVP